MLLVPSATNRNCCLGSGEKASSKTLVPPANLPESKKGRWGEGLTATEMGKCIWLKPKLVAAIEYAEWAPANHLRHAKFIGRREDKKPSEVNRERPADERHRAEEESI